MERAFRRIPSKESNNKNVSGVPLVVTYNPAFKNLPQAIRRNLELL